MCSLLGEELLPAGPGGHALPVAVKVPTALSFFASGSFQSVTGDISRVYQSAAPNCIRQVRDGLFARAVSFVNFPCDDKSQNERALGFASLAGFSQVQVAIDYTHVAIRAPPDQPGAFVNSKAFHSINVQLVFNHKKRFMQVWARFPGSCHDAFILWQSNIPNLLVPGSRLRGWLLDDKGYLLQTWLITPLRNPTNEPQEHYTASHMSTRYVIEQAIGMLKMRFRCLDRSGGALQYSPGSLG
ncbi:putative nuclease HARBI1 [Heptranchias perlo]|uniref:putative nuclease HARBI1 n=1 Tax=Heptranchias perlo TaxID=212740 RepID=UPI003559DA14